MQTKTISIYNFDELDEDAKERARDWARGIDDLYGWHDDNVQSLIEFAKFVGGNKDYSISLVGYSSAKVKIDEYDWYDDYDHEEEGYYRHEMKGDYLLYWLKDNIKTIEGSCPFTGYCMDEDLLDPMRKFLANPNPDTTFQELVDECVDAWVKQYVADWESTYEDEQIDDFLSANEYDFLEDGSIYWK